MIPSVLVLGFALPLPPVAPDPVRSAVAAATPMLIAGATGHAERRTCFACHNQGLPALALQAARSRGIAVPEEFLTSQAEHIAGFLAANAKDFRAGKGTGGQATTAAYALFTLELLGHRPDDATAAVAEYLLKFQANRDHWTTTADRPPSETSHFTATYLAMRALRVWGAKADRERIDRRIEAARTWLIKTPARDTEDRVFRLLALKEAGVGEKELAAASWELLKTQRRDGGWGQLDSLASDAYATGSSLYALHQAAGLAVDAPAYRAGVAYLLKTQSADGTWHVKTRSKPIQQYYESGFPHGKDQFISIDASGWATAALAAALAPVPIAAAPIKHAFLAAGNETFIVDADRKVIWSYPASSRDGWVLGNGNVLLALTKSKMYPGGAVVEVNRDGKILFEFKGTQTEVNTVQPLGDGKVLLTEAGDKPRILEVTRDGKISAEVPIQAQTNDHHLQTRMTRKLSNGNYLVPQLLDRVVREYDPKGKVVWEVKTPNMPFTAIRLPDGNTLIGCTLGNLVIEVDRDGHEVWRVGNDDLPGKPINDACGVQRLENGNTVITSHHAAAGQVKLTEVTRDKKIVWTYTDTRKSGIHHFQILDPDGKATAKPWR